MCKAAKRFNQQSRLIYAFDGKVWRNTYAIKVLTESNKVLIRNRKRIRIKIINKSQTFY